MTDSTPNPRSRRSDVLVTLLWVVAIAATAINLALMNHSGSGARLAYGCVTIVCAVAALARRFGSRRR